MQKWNERTELLLGNDKLEILNSSNVLVVGVGGVGAYAAEMLCRGGVGNITIIDADSVSVSNINRQLVALNSTVGELKVDVLAKRLLDINPKLNLRCRAEYVTADTIEDIVIEGKYNYVVDAIDTLAPKSALIKACVENGVKVVSSMGAGAKTDPTLVQIEDISKSKYCPLAHMLRKRLNKHGIKKGFYVVFSTEEVREGAMVLCEERNKKSNVGTISYMPTIFGCACASVVVRDLLGEPIKQIKRG